MTIAGKAVNLFIGFAFTFFATVSWAENHEAKGKDGNHQDSHGEVVHAEGQHEEHGEHESHSHYEGKIDTKEEVALYKEHHLLDAHDFTFFSDNEAGKHYGFPLPVIFWDSETGLHTMMSSAFHHGESTVESKGAQFKINNHGKIVKINTDGEESKVLDFSITKNVLGIILAALIMFLLFRGLAKSYSRGPIPTGMGRVLEPLVLYVRDEIARPNIGEHKYKRFMSFLLTVFFFIWILNLLGMTPLAFNVTGNIAITACLALFTFFIVQFSGNKEYWGHIFWMPGVPTPMKIVLAPIEVLGMFTKPFSLMIRLFANITAGHMVVMSLIALTILLKSQFTIVGSTGISIFLSLFISLIELLVAFLQAYIFTMLSSLFIGMAVAEHDHH